MVVFAFFPLVILPLVLGMFIRILVKSRKRFLMEEQDTPLYSCTCSGKIGKLMYRGPFVRVALYHGYLVISGAKRFLLPMNSILDMTEVKPGPGYRVLKLEFIHEVDGDVIKAPFFCKKDRFDPFLSRVGPPQRF